MGSTDHLIRAAAHLAWVLENVVNQITVDPATTKWAQVALERMLAGHLSLIGDATHPPRRRRQKRLVRGSRGHARGPDRRC